MIFVNDAFSYQEWRRWRELGLGGSEAPTIMDSSKWETPQELWGRRTGRLAEKPTSPPMARGIRLEADARESYEELTGIAMPKQLGIHDVHDWLRASFDGFSREAGRAIEIKCPGEADHHLACQGKIPPHYLWQLVHLLLVSDLPVMDYVSYDERTIAVIPFERNLELEGRLLKKELQFWQYIKNDVCPPTREELEERRGVRKTAAERMFKVRRSR